MKKYSLLFLLMVSSAKAGFYTGVEMGCYHTNITLDSKINIDGHGSGSNTTNLSDTGASLSLLIGFQKDYDGYFIGSEIFASQDDLLDARSQEKEFSFQQLGGFSGLGTYRFRVQKLQTFGASILAGINVNKKFRPYVSFDILRSQYQFTAKMLEPSSCLNRHQKKSLWGGAPGAGLEYKFNDKFSARLSYKLAIYERFNANEIHFLDDVHGRNNFKPYNHQVKFGLFYHF